MIPAVGSRVHGFASGVFGRDSYDCRTVEAVGLDWVVTRNDKREVEFATLERFERIHDPEDRSHCSCPPEGRSVPVRPSAGLCHCDGPPHPYDPGWCTFAPVTRR